MISAVKENIGAVEDVIKTDNEIHHDYMLEKLKKADMAEKKKEEENNNE